MATVLTEEEVGNRIFGLDVLRAFAILGVVAMHGNELLPEKVKNFCTKFLFFFDWVGIFFVLSGFLVGGILIRGMDKGRDISIVLVNFWIRRWLRTLPAYFVILLLLVIIHAVYDPEFSMLTVWKYPLFLQNFASPIPKFFMESWSLCVEEWFYLMIPLLIAALMKLGRLSCRSAVVVASIAVIVFCSGIRVYRYCELSAQADLMVYILNARLQVITRLDGIMFGVLGAFWSHYYARSFLRHKQILLWVSIALWLLTAYLRRFYPDNIEIYVGSFYWWVIDFVVVSIATLFCLPCLSTWRSAKGRLQSAIVGVSTISYSMYLVNASLIQGYILGVLIPWDNFIDDPGVLVASRYVMYWVAVFALSVLLYRFCELPMMRLRESKAVAGAFLRSRSSATQPSS